MPLNRRPSRQRISAGGLLSVIAAASSRANAVAIHSATTGTCSTATSTSCPAFLAPHEATGLSLGSNQRHLLSARRMPRPATCRVHSRRCRSRRIRVLMDRQAGEHEGGEGAGRWSGRPRKTRPLAFLAEAVNAAILEMCVENQGRPLAMAMTDLVERAVEAFVSGYPLEALLLELQLLDSTTRVPGETLTGVEKRYRTQWIGALHAVMQNLNLVEQREPKTAEEFHMKSQVDVVLRGRQTNDEQTFVKFDKALATGGVAGGVATERIVIVPQMVPISQLVLLAIRALQKLEDAAAA